MLVDVHRGAAGVAAGQVGEGRAAVGRAEDVLRVHEDDVGVVGIDGDALVVPVLSVVAVAAGQAGLAGALLPGGAAVRRAPDAELAAALGAAGGENGLHLHVDHVGVAGGDGGVEAAQPVAGKRGGVDRNAAGGVGRPAVVGPAERFPTRRTAAGRQQGAIDAVGAVLVQVVLYRGSKPACADEGVDLGVGSRYRAGSARWCPGAGW